MYVLRKKEVVCTASYASDMISHIFERGVGARKIHCTLSVIINVSCCIEELALSLLSDMAKRIKTIYDYKR